MDFVLGDNTIMPSRSVALVTGASSGMGVAFAHELARRKYDLVITARRLDRLQELAKELEQAYDVQVTPLPWNLSEPQAAQALYDEIRRQSIAVDLLVNNAGLGKYGPLLDQSWKELENMIAVNLVSLTQLTWLFAGDMRERGDGGYILNHASFAAIQAPPDYAVYAATKSYVLSFSRTAAFQLRRENIQVCALCSGFIDTDFYDVAGQQPNWMIRLLMLKPVR